MKLSGPALEKIDKVVLQQLLEVAPRIAEKDASVWGADTEAENRLNWIDLPINSRKLLPEVDALSAWARSHGLTEVILAGMGGSSLAPEVIASTFAKSVVILDSTDPKQVTDSLPISLKNSLIIIASKSGTTIETLSHFQFYESVFKNAELNPNEHIVIITDPETTLDQDARLNRYKVINADAKVGGRFSALSAFGLVPAALLGVDISILLDDAEKISSKLSRVNSPAIAIAACLYSLSDQIINFCDQDSKTPGLSNWIEQLISESTGKDEKGRLPIVVKDPREVISGISIGFGPGDYDLVIDATLGEQFLLWEWVVVLLCYLLKVDPFSQPNVTEVKELTTSLLESSGNESAPFLIQTYEDADLVIYSNNDFHSLTDFLKVNAKYYAVLAYLARGSDDEVVRLQSLIASASDKPTSFGWGPRYLHSTGQLHKGGQQNGAFIQLTGHHTADIKIPNQNYSFSQLAKAQALAETITITRRNLAILHIHLKDRKKGIDRLISELQGINPHHVTS